jgi:hypothetical protein
MLAPFLMTGTPAAAQMGYATIYSGASTGSNGTVYGWGVTDVTYTDSYHTAQVTTWLSSPNGRYANGGGTAYNFVRGDTSLPYVANDLGTYFVSSTHYGTCQISGPLWPSPVPTNKQTTVPYVVLTLRNAGTVSADNGGLSEFNSRLGSTNLGTRYYPTYAIWGTGVEIVGTVYPTNFTGSITIRREIREDKTYVGSSLLRQDAPPIHDDTTDDLMRDDLPQSGGSGGKVYDLDAPGMGGIPNGATYRVRTNFRQWAVLNSLSLVVSPIDLYWYSRISVKGTATGDQLATDVSGDNVASVGVTKTTWNLQ